MAMTVKEILGSLIEALLILMLFGIFNNQRKFIFDYKIKAILFCTIHTLFSYWATIFIPFTFHIVLIFLFTATILSYIGNVKIYSALVINAISLIYIAVTETIIMVYFMLTLHAAPTVIMQDPYYSTIACIIAKTAQFAGVLLFSKSKFDPNKYKIFKRHESTSSYLILQLMMFTLLNLNVSTGPIVKEKIILYNSIVFCIFIAFIGLSFFDLNERNKIQRIIDRYKVQEEHITQMKSIISIIRAERHDFANHINTIQAICSLNKEDSITKIKNYVEIISKTIHKSFKFFETGNDYIDGMLAIKNNVAMQNGISFDVHIEESFNAISIPADELISIVSNLIDNAFEAFNLEQEIKEIYITAFRESDLFCIEIANNGEVISEEIQKRIFEKGFTTKYSDKSDRGFGLFITKELIEKNKGSISVESAASETKFIVRLPCPPSGLSTG